MTKLCDPMIWPDWPDRVQVIDSKSEEFRNYYPERTCHDKMLAYLTYGCSACGVEWRGDIVPNYCPNCGAKVVE